MSPTSLPRREFLRRTLWATSAPLLAGSARAAFGALPAKPKVIHVHHGRAATWNNTSGFYRDFVDQAKVRSMLDLAVQDLKGGTLDQAWKKVFPLASPATRKLAIKVSCNNSYTPDGCGNETDATPEPAIAAVRGFLRAGGSAQNVTIYDATTSNGGRSIPTWFRDRVLTAVPGVQFLDRQTAKGGTYNARTHVTWSAGYAGTPPPTRIADVVLLADYLINVPLVRRHVGAGFSLGYKNHYGTVENVHLLHPYTWEDFPSGSVLADIMGSPRVTGDATVKSLARKTVLTIGDLLLAQPCKNYGYSPVPWNTFGREWPNSLIVSDDPVAADSVMLDLLEAEPPSGDCGAVAAWARRYLSVAAARGQGVYEHLGLPPGTPFDPKRMVYTKIDYLHRELMSGGADLHVARSGPQGARLDWNHYFTGPCEIWRASRPDFSDGVLLTTTNLRTYVDASLVQPAYYRVTFVG